jgi:hypothetical protein
MVVEGLKSLVHRQEHDLDVGIGVLELDERIEPVEVRHGDIGHDDVRLQCSRRLQ